MPYGICKICGCTNSRACYHPEHGFCWWVDDTHELCSHCADKKIADDPRTERPEKDLFEYETRVASEDNCESPCDLCERVVCIGVDNCEEEYGVSSYFVRKEN